MSFVLGVLTLLHVYSQQMPSKRSYRDIKVIKVFNSFTCSADKITFCNLVNISYNFLHTNTNFKFRNDFLNFW